MFRLIIPSKLYRKPEGNIRPPGIDISDLHRVAGRAIPSCHDSILAVVVAWLHIG